MGTEDDLRRLSGLATDALAAVQAGQNAGLALLLAEMKALFALLPTGLEDPGLPLARDDMAGAEARARAQATVAESTFDNMPV